MQTYLVPRHSHCGRLGACLLFFVVSLSVRGAVIFQDGFESGTLGSAWLTSGTNDGRVTVTSDFVPATGSKHLVLDDGVNDVIYSVAEATLQLDLTGRKNVVLTFKAKSLGNEPHPGPTSNFSGTRAYDGVAISTNGGSTWRVIQPLDTVSPSWQTYSIALDSVLPSLGGSFGANFRIRFSEYDNAPAPLDGIAIDDVVLSGDDNWQSLLELPSPLIEGTGAQTGYVVLSFTPTSDLVLQLITSPSGQLSLPQSVTVPAGQNSASFQFGVIDDNVVNLTRGITVWAGATGVTAQPGTVTIYDD